MKKFKNYFTSNALTQGFTLIELLIVIAILGTLAVVVLLALNPVQQLARTRDAGRISTATQLGHAIEAYATNNNGSYPAAAATWGTTLVNSGEIALVPTGSAYTAGTVTAACNGAGGVNGIGTTNVNWCYNYVAGTGAVVYTRLESTANRSKCNVGGATETWFVYSTAAGRGGGVCTNPGTPPAAGVTTFNF